MLFNYYPGNIRQNRPLGTITLDAFLNKIRQPKPEVVETIKTIRTAIDRAKIDTLKRTLYYFTPAVGPMDIRRYDAIQSFTGLAVLDFDKRPEQAATIKRVLFKSYPCVVATWLSSSGRGVRGLIRIPIVDTVDEYKSYFHGFREEVECLYPGFDIAPQNPVLPLFMSYDPDIMIRTDAEYWTTKALPPPLPTVPKPLPKQYETTNDDRNHVVNIITKTIRSIDAPGHPQLRAICYATGGYVGGGLLTQSEAIDIVEHLVRSNAYLGQRHKVNGYLKTAQEMIIKGQNQPLHI